MKATAPAINSSMAAPAMSDMAAPAMQEQMMGQVNINTADAETLQKELSGIGKGKALAIVAYREANGEFTSVDELIEVKGIGKAILDKNRDKISIQ
ncbi:ComEA family DNA-binding protein [Pseudomonas syringae]